MLAAFAPRRFGVQDRLVLARVQMPPLALRLMVVELAGSPAFWTRPIDQVVVSQANMDLALFQLQVHRVHVPGGLDSENTPIQFTILHPWNCRTSSSSQLRLPTTKPEFPMFKEAGTHRA